MPTTKRFSKNGLLDLGLPHDAADGVVLVDRLIGARRWSIDHELVFRLPGQPEGEAWHTTYSVGATESQDESPWQYINEVTCTLVHEVEKMVKVWEAKP